MKFFNKKRQWFASLCATALTLGVSLSTISCSSDKSDDDDDLSALDSTPLIVTEVEFAAARYRYSFVTQTGQLIEIIPTQASVVGGDVQAVMNITSAGVSTPVTLNYIFNDEFFGEDAEGIVAEGIMVITFNETTGSPIEFFSALGVTITPAAPLEGEEEGVASLPADSAFAINILFVNPEGSEQIAAAQVMNPLSTVTASWTTALGSINEDAELVLWFQTLLQGAYKIERNL